MKALVTSQTPERLERSRLEECILFSPEGRTGASDIKLINYNVPANEDKENRPQGSKLIKSPVIACAQRARRELDSQRPKDKGHDSG
jgi:hypothetical protein